RPRLNSTRCPSGSRRIHRTSVVTPCGRPSSAEVGRDRRRLAVEAKPRFLSSWRRVGQNVVGDRGMSWCCPLWIGAVGWTPWPGHFGVDGTWANVLEYAPCLQAGQRLELML